MAAKLIQIYYDESQKAQLYDFAIPLCNKKLTIFFENEVISRVVKTTAKLKKVDKISVCSWKLRLKMRPFQYEKGRELTQDVMDSDYDVLAFTNNSHHHNVFEFGGFHHVGFLDCLKALMVKIDKQMPGRVRNPIYLNHFSAKTEIYLDYVRDYLDPAMKVMTEDEELNKMVMQDSGYASKINASGEFLTEKIGINYWPIAPFILERLFSIYCQNKSINVTKL